MDLFDRINGGWAGVDLEKDGQTKKWKRNETNKWQNNKLKTEKLEVACLEMLEIEIL